MRIPKQQKIFRTSRRTAIGPVAFAIVLLLSVVTTPAAQAQTYTVIHTLVVPRVPIHMLASPWIRQETSTEPPRGRLGGFWHGVEAYPLRR